MRDDVATTDSDESSGEARHSIEVERILLAIIFCNW